MTTDLKTTSYEALYAEEAAVARAQALICWVMDQKGVSQRELAERLHVSEAAISKMLGSSPANLTVRRLARVLNALDDRLNLSSELRDFAVPNQPPCGVTKDCTQRVWEDVKETSPLTRENYGGRMIFEYILYPSNEHLRDIQSDCYEYVLPKQDWRKTLFNSSPTQTSHRRNRALKVA